jgi:hypothetical protein
MTIGAPTTLYDAVLASATAQTRTITPTVAQTNGRQAFLCLVVGRTTGNAAQPSSVTATGATFAIFGTPLTGVTGNFWMGVYVVTGTITGNITVDHGSAITTNLGAILIEFPGVDTATPTVAGQYASSNNPVTYNAVTNSRINLALPSAVTAGNAILTFCANNSQAQSMDPLTSGFTEATADASGTSPSMHTAGAYNLSPSSTSSDWYSDGSAQKVGISLEVDASAASTDPWTYKKFARFG